MTPLARLENSLAQPLVTQVLLDEARADRRPVRSSNQPLARRTLTLVDSRPPRTPHEAIGFALGWDYARYRVMPPTPCAEQPLALHEGLRAGEASFGRRTLSATRQVRKWLQLRLHAWLRGRSVELVQVTPNYLKQLEVAHCPITRVALSNATLEASDASIDRVRNDAGYAAGNLAVMSTQANHAKAALGFRGANARVAQIEGRQIESGQIGNAQIGNPQAPAIDGLTAAQWARVAVLCSFVEPLPHAEAIGVPLLVLPPNRLRLLNPAQALQAFVSRQLLTPGWSQRVSRFEALLPGAALKRDFKSFFMALLPRVIEGGRLYAEHTARWAVEDAWRSPLVQQRWREFAAQLSPAQCEALLLKAAARQLATRIVVAVSDANATDGWNLATRGRVPHGAGLHRGPHEMRQAQLC